MSRYPRDNQRRDQDDRASGYPRRPERPLPRQNNSTQRQPPREPNRTRRIDDEPAWDDYYPPSRGAAPRERYSDGQGRRVEPRPNIQPGSSDRRASRAPARPVSRPPSSRRDNQHARGVAAWDNPKPRRGWDNESDDWDNGPRDWDDKQWWLEEQRGGAQPRRSSSRNRQRTGLADDDVDGGNWVGNGRNGRSRPQYRDRGIARPGGGLAGWWETSRQWVAQRGQRGQRTARPERTGAQKGQKTQTAQKTGLFGLSRRATTWVVVAVIVVCALGSALTPFLLYQQTNAMAHSGLQHIKNAEADLKKVQSNPLDANSVHAAREEFAAANSDFSGINARLTLAGIASGAPKVGSKISSAQRLVPIAVEATKAGMLACDAMYILASSLKNPFGTNGGTLTNDRYATIADDWSKVHMLADTIINQLGQVTPSDLSLDPRLGPAITQFRAKLPQITQLINDFDGIVQALPQLLGVEKPSTYLMLILDSSELRPTGGFIGNFGTLTINRGQMDPGFKITDITLIDYNTKFWDRIPANYKQVIPIPPQYEWLKQVWVNPADATWSLRDSNLDPDFPTTAKAAIDLYSQLQPGAQKTLDYQKNTLKLYDPKANGQFVGVVTLSLGFFVEALKATGAVNVDLQPTKGPAIHEVVTSDNFVTLIHKYALGTGSTGSDSQVCGTTSCNKVFTSAVVKAFMAKIKSDPKQYIGKLGKILLASLRTKDVEFFINDPKAEKTLIDLGIGAQVQAPKSGDSLLQVDANIGANKDNALLHYKMADQITIDQSGAATHKFTWQYTWPTDPQSLNETFKAVDAGPNYYAYSRVFTPPGAKLISQSANLRNFGWTDASTETFNRAVFYGNVFVPAILGQTTAFDLSWKVPGVVTHDDAGYHYHLLVQRQAGIIWPLTLTIKLPACAKIVGTPQASGLKSPYANDATPSATPGATATPTATATATPAGTPASPNPVTVKGTTVTVTAPLTQDEQIQINYTC